MGGDADRFLSGIDLLDAGKGSSDYFYASSVAVAEPPARGRNPRQARRALTMGVNPNQILLTGIRTTTADEANEIKMPMEFAAGMERDV